MKTPTDIDPYLIETDDVTGDATFIHSPDCGGWCDFACNSNGFNDATAYNAAKQHTPEKDPAKSEDYQQYVANVADKCQCEERLSSPTFGAAGDYNEETK